MHTWSVLCALVIAAASAYFVFMPVIRKQADPAAASARAAQLETLLGERDAIYEAIRELDFDHATGKIIGEDHAMRREQLAQRGVEVLKAIDQINDSV